MASAWIGSGLRDKYGDANFFTSLQQPLQQQQPLRQQQPLQLHEEKEDEHADAEAEGDPMDMDMMELETDTSVPSSSWRLREWTSSRRRELPAFSATLG